MQAAHANVRPLRKTETRELRFRRWLAIREAIDSGKQVSIEDAVWCGSYGETSECRSMKLVYADFGEEALK